MRTISSIVVPLLLFFGALAAESPEDKGYRLAKRSDESNKGFGSSTVELTMILRNAAGAEAERKLNIRTLEAESDDVGDKSVVLFSSPPDVDGTALLSHVKILEPDDQWLYLPAIRRVKRIASKNKSGPFVGSEFAFEDFTALELNKFTYKWLREENYQGMPCDVIERIPRYEYSGYTKQISWIDQKDYQTRKVESYDRRGGLYKTLTLEDYRLYEGQFWRAHRMMMTNHQTRKSTELIYSDYQLKAGLRERDFTKSALEALR